MQVFGGPCLTGAVMVSAPAQFQVSLQAGTGFGASVSLPQTGGRVASTPVYVRFNPTGGGIITGSLQIASPGATTRTVSLTGSAASLSASNGGLLTCAQPSLVLTASGGTTYSFSGPAGALTSSGNQATVSQPGGYTVTVSSPNGCTAVVTTTVESSTAPPANVSLSGGTLTYTQPSLTLTAAATGSGLTYAFSTGATPLGGNTTNTASVSAGGTYSVVVTGANGCSATATATVGGNTTPPPPPSLLTQSGQTYPGGQASVSVAQYSGTVTLVPTGCPGSLNWSGPSNTSGTGTIGVSTTTTGTFVYTATCQVGACPSAPASATVVVRAAPLSLLAPRYDCATRQLSLQTTGGNGQPVEYQIASLTTSWEGVSNTFIVQDKHIGKELKLRARQRSTSGGYTEVGLSFTPTACGAGRLGADESGTGLQVVVLEVEGAEGQPLRVQLTDVRGRAFSERLLERAGAVERLTLPMGQQPAGLLLLRVSTPTQSRTVKVMKAE